MIILNINLSSHITNHIFLISFQQLGWSLVVCNGVHSSAHPPNDSSTVSQLGLRMKHKENNQKLKWRLSFMRSLGQLFVQSQKCASIHKIQEGMRWVSQNMVLGRGGPLEECVK